MSAVLEVDLTVATAFAVEATFVNETMMVTAKQDEVVETRFPTVGPVLDVVTVAELVARAAREAATAVACL